MSDEPPSFPTALPRAGFVRHVSLRFAIVVFFSLFGLGLAGPLALYNYARSTDSALDVARGLIQKSGDTVLLKTRLVIQPFNFLADNIQLMPGACALPQGFEHPLMGMFLNVLTKNPQIYSLYFGYGDGSFYQLISLQHRPQLSLKLKAPPGAAFAVRSIAMQNGKHMVRWLFLGPDQKRLGMLPPTPSNYDPACGLGSSPPRRWTAHSAPLCTCSAARRNWGSRCRGACRAAPRLFSAWI